MKLWYFPAALAAALVIVAGYFWSIGNHTSPVLVLAIALGVVLVAVIARGMK